MVALQMDVLNQISLILRANPEQAPRLRRLLKDTTELNSYQQWMELDQFAGVPFRLPQSFIWSDSKDRRLLESFRLVIDDVLQVKINSLDDGSVYVTDGLFVPADIRVFSWHDESDLILNGVRMVGWDRLPSVVIDPCTGCGHNLLRAEATSRIGLDISTRALCFASINALLNERPATLLGLNDIRDGIPAVARAPGQRVLFLINMPFALEPIPGSLLRTAAGGVNGYERTVDALRAISAYAKAAVGQEVRAVILSYSVGNQRRNTWHVAQEAAEIFGEQSVDWRVLRDEKLWRINGKKEQPNPMPLHSLRLKADCKYYVRNPEMRDSIRQGYVEKQRELEALGYDSLAYGLLTIDLTGDQGIRVGRDS